MADSHLTASPSPKFPQPRSGDTIVNLFHQVDSLMLRTQLGYCDYQGRESQKGACDAFVCDRRATVHEIDGEHEYCVEHFWAVQRG